MTAPRFVVALLAMCVGSAAGCGKKSDDANKDKVATKDDKGTAAKSVGTEPAKGETVDVTLMVKGVGAGLAAKDFSLTAGAQAVVASNAATLGDSGQRVSVVVLIQGDEPWIGNDTVVDEDDPDRMEGAFVGLPPALDKLAAALPKGAKTAVLSYDMAVNVLKPLDESPLAGAALGEQKDFRDKIGTGLIPALAEATAMLSKETGRRILVVFGDGGGLQEDITADVASSVERLQALRADVFTIWYAAIPSESSTEAQNMATLGYSGSYRASSREHFASMTDQLASELATSYYVTFAVPKAEAANTDGFALKVVNKDTEFELAP